jgi:hypothetical protein
MMMLSSSLLLLLLFLMMLMLLLSPCTSLLKDPVEALVSRYDHTHCTHVQVATEEEYDFTRLAPNTPKTYSAVPFAALDLLSLILFLLLLMLLLGVLFCGPLSK